MRDLIARINDKASRRANWRKTDVLILDEGERPFRRVLVASLWLTNSSISSFAVSMISAKMFDTLEEIARNIRGSKAPFGGMQVIVFVLLRLLAFPPPPSCTDLDLPLSSEEPATSFNSPPSTSLPRPPTSKSRTSLSKPTAGLELSESLSTFSRSFDRAIPPSSVISTRFESDSRTGRRLGSSTSFSTRDGRTMSFLPSCSLASSFHSSQPLDALI